MARLMASAKQHQSEIYTTNKKLYTPTNEAQIKHIRCRILYVPVSYQKTWRLHSI